MSIASETPYADFETHFKQGKTQLIWKWVAGDLETPVSAYLKLTQAKSYSFLLESVEGGKTLGRYSIIGAEPDQIWSYQKGKTNIHDCLNGGSTTIDTPTLQSLRETINACHIDISNENLPPMAVSGLFGYLGYDTTGLVEDLPNNNPDDLNIPDSIFIRPQLLVIFDNVKNMICFVQPIYQHAQNTQTTAQTIYQGSIGYLSNKIKELNSTIKPSLLEKESKITTPLSVKSNTEKEDFLSAVDKTVDYIRQGEIFQAVISQRFESDFDLPAYELYRALRSVNPSPFLFYLQFEDFALVGSSPEVLVRVRDQKVTIRPIAGTRKRGKNEAEDLALEQELLADTKERAEHLMLLDLGRNDVGRVCEYGSVKVTGSFLVERYSHVMHIVSNVEGTLSKDKDSLDAFFSGFPAGTVSGAPKIRAMEIIDELEKNKRKSYAGAVGYFSGNGDIDSCIALRTALVKDGKIYVQAGGGIVADSKPEFEYQESVNKAGAVIRAAELAVERSKPR